MNFPTNTRPASFTRRALLGMLTLGSLTLATPAQAQTTPAAPVQIMQLNEASLRLRIANPGQQHGRVEVLHLNTGQPLFTETYSDAAYGHRFNFQDLPTGTYALKLKVGPDRYNYTIQVATTAAGSTVAVKELATRQTGPVLAAAIK